MYISVATGRNMIDKKWTYLKELWKDCSTHLFFLLYQYLLVSHFLLVVLFSILLQEPTMHLFEPWSPCAIVQSRCGFWSREEHYIENIAGLCDGFLCYLAEDTCLHQLHFYQSTINVPLPMGRMSMSVGKASDKWFSKFILAYGLFNRFSVHWQLLCQLKEECFPIFLRLITVFDELVRTIHPTHRLIVLVNWLRNRHWYLLTFSITIFTVV